MAKVFQYMLRVSGWEQVAAGVTANEAQVPQLVAGAWQGSLAQITGLRITHP